MINFKRLRLSLAMFFFCSIGLMPAFASEMTAQTLPLPEEQSITNIRVVEPAASIHRQASEWNYQQYLDYMSGHNRYMLIFRVIWPNRETYLDGMLGYDGREESNSHVLILSQDDRRQWDTGELKTQDQQNETDHVRYFLSQRLSGEDRNVFEILQTSSLSDGFQPQSSSFESPDELFVEQDLPFTQDDLWELISGQTQLNVVQSDARGFPVTVRRGSYRVGLRYASAAPGPALEIHWDHPDDDRDFVIFVQHLEALLPEEGEAQWPHLQRWEEVSRQAFLEEPEAQVEQ